jgi:uncharacterized phage protein (TIGR01671 family)
MEDRYLFKAKRIDNGEWVTGQYVKGLDMYGKEVHLIFEPTTIFYSSSETDGWSEIDPSTICQCTGLKDKNGKLIWENDIVNCLAEECCGYIGWNEDEAGFYFNVLLEDGTYEEEHIYDYVDCMEIIGNTFDNMELLERSIE